MFAVHTNAANVCSVFKDFLGGTGNCVKVQGETVVLGLDCQVTPKSTLHSLWKV